MMRNITQEKALWRVFLISYTLLQTNKQPVKTRHGNACLTQEAEVDRSLGVRVSLVCVRSLKTGLHRH